MISGVKMHKPGEPWRPTAGNVRSVAQALDDVEDTWLEMAGYPVQLPNEGEASAGELAKRIKQLPLAERQAVETLVVSILRARGYIAEESVLVKSGGGEAAKQGVLSGDPEPARGLESHEERASD